MRPSLSIAAVLLRWVFLCAGVAPPGAIANALTTSAGGTELLTLFDVPEARAGEARLRAIGASIRVGFERAAVVWNLAGESGERAAVRVDFPASPRGTALEARRAEGIVLAGEGDARGWDRASAFHEVRYRGIAPGADLVYRARDGHLVNEIVVAPGSSLSVVRLRHRGVNRIEIDASGRLGIHTAAGMTRVEPPALYQESGAGRVAVSGGFRIIGQNELGFWAGNHDATLELIVETIVPD